MPDRPMNGVRVLEVVAQFSRLRCSPESAPVSPRLSMCHFSAAVSGPWAWAWTSLSSLGK
jgi:hypothetical protein